VEIRKYKFEWLLLTLGIIFSAVSLYIDIQSVSETTWFARSGSIVVLLAVVVEYRLSSYLYDDIDTAAKKTARKKAVMPSFSDNSLTDGLVKANFTSKPKPPKSRSILAFVSHFLVILGTVIWGYGDKFVG